MSRKLHLAPALLVATLVAAACGSSDANDSTTTAEVAPTTAEVSTTTAPAASVVTDDVTVPPTDSSPATSAAASVEIIEDVPYTSEQQLDIYVPGDGAEWPVVVYFHGGNPTQNPELRKLDRPTAQALAEQGVLVYVPTWNGMGPAGGSEESICALAFARATAADHGGDPERVMPAGYSAGGYSAVIHALIADDPPLPITDCVVDPTIPAPAAVAGGGSSLFVADWGRQGLFNFPEWTSLTPEQIDAFDPFLAVDAGRNSDLHIVLVVGEDDQGTEGNFPIAESNLEFADAAERAGYDVELILMPGGHGEPTLTGSDQFTTWVDTIARTARALG
jgi:acetyl esterase/lipase